MREHGSRARDSLEVLWVGDLSLFDPSSSDSLLLRHLSQHPVELDLALIVPERGASSSHFEGEFGKGIKRRGLFFVPRSPSPVGDLLLPFSQPMLPKEFFPYFSPKVSQAFQALLQGKVRQLKDLGVRGEMSALIPEWDAVVFSGLNGAVHLFDGKRFQLPPSFPPAFYHAPGVLSEKRLRLSRVRPREGQRRQLRREAAKLKEFELAFLRKVDAVFAPSPPTVERFQQLLPRVCVHELPAAVELAPFSGQHPGEGNTAFFVLFESSSEGCRQGLTWLLREVWPEVAERDATRVLIVFSQNEDARRYLPKALRELPGVSFESDQPEKHLNHSLAVLVPYFSDDVTHEAVRLAARAHRVALLPDEAAREMSLVDGKSCLVLERSEQDVSRWIFSLAREKGEALLSLGEALAAHLTQRHDPVQAAQQLFSVLSSATGGAESAASERGVLP